MKKALVVILVLAVCVAAYFFAGAGNAGDSAVSPTPGITADATASPSPAENN